MISSIIKTEVCVICQSWRLRQITQTWGFDNSWYHVKTEFNNNCFILYIFDIIHPQKQKRSVQPFCFSAEHSKGLSNQADIELDMINAILHLSCQVHKLELIECSRPIRFFIASLMYNNTIYLPYLRTTPGTQLPQGQKRYCI